VTRSHRRQHLAAWIVLTPAVLWVLVAALAVRAAARSHMAGAASTPQQGGRP
jgi:hypothetical protein